MMKCKSNQYLEKLVEKIDHSKIISKYEVFDKEWIMYENPIKLNDGTEIDLLKNADTLNYVYNDESTKCQYVIVFF